MSSISILGAPGVFGGPAGAREDDGVPSTSTRAAFVSRVHVAARKRHINARSACPSAKKHCICPRWTQARGTQRGGCGSTRRHTPTRCFSSAHAAASCDLGGVTVNVFSYVDAQVTVPMPLVLLASRGVALVLLGDGGQGGRGMGRVEGGDGARAGVGVVVWRALGKDGRWHRPARRWRSGIDHFRL